MKKSSNSKKGQQLLYVDQYGDRFYASTVKELREQIGLGGSRVRPMYFDGKDGKLYKCGYVVGKHWCDAYAPHYTEVK